MNNYWFRVKVHPTWHLTAVCIGVVLGAVVSAWLRLDGIICLALAGIAFLLVLVRPLRILLVVSLTCGMIAGIWRGSVDQFSLDAYQGLYGQHVRLAGTVADDIDTNARGQAVIHLTDITDGKHKVSGKIWVAIDSHAARNVERGDNMTVDGLLEEGFGSYAASMYTPELVRLQREADGDPALHMRDAFASNVGKAIKEPEASLGIGFLLGQKRGLPEHLTEALQIAGLTHIVVASGYNLTILVRLARRLFENVSKYLSTLSGVLLIVGFVAITGLSPSMTRAGLVAGLGLWAWYYGRKFHPFTLLVLAMAVTVLWNPSYVWGDLGWALSFAAFGGVMIVAPLLQAYFYGDEKPPFLIQLMGETFAAQLATAPIILLAFGQFSNIAMISNILILPFIPLAMLLVAVAGVGVYVVPGAGGLFGWPAEQLLKAMVWIIEKTAGVEWAQSHWQLNGWGVGVWYLLLVLVCGYFLYRTRYRLYQASIVE